MMFPISPWFGFLLCVYYLVSEDVVVQQYLSKDCTSLEKIFLFMSSQMCSSIKYLFSPQKGLELSQASHNSLKEMYEAGLKFSVGWGNGYSVESSTQ